MIDAFVPSAQRFAAIEAGGTKVVCGVGSFAGGSFETARIETRKPGETITDIAAFFRTAAARHGPLSACGIASFGPLDLDPRSPHYGAIQSTTKPGWSGFDMLGAIRAALGIPTAIDTDVNAAALAEARASGITAGTVAYVTVGTGIGVGFARNGANAGVHAEAGHFNPRRHPGHGDFAGVCPYHRDCLEGLASGPALIAAWGGSLATLAPDHVAWAIEADYLGQLCAALVLMHAPARIVLGGGVMAQRRLLPVIRTRTLHWLADYPRAHDLAWAERLIVPPACREPSGLLGAYLLAEGAAAH